MEKNISSAKEKGIKAGAICFSCFMVPWLFLLFGALLFSEGFDRQTIIGFIALIYIFILVSSFLGFSIARESRRLIIISSILVAAVPITWIILAIIVD
jgi:hypothetical protein